jgi:ketosteroid isomerase-like protein
LDPKLSVTATTLKSFLDAFNRHDLDDVMSFFTENPVLEMPRGSQPWGSRAEGRAEVRAWKIVE